MTKLSILAAGLMLSTVGFAHAQKLDLPVGSWAPNYGSKPNCKKPDITFTSETLIRHFKKGNGRCSVTFDKKEGDYKYYNYKCNFDKTVNIAETESPDEDNTGFSLIVKSENSILYNNTNYSLCPSSPKESR